MRRQVIGAACLGLVSLTACSPNNAKDHYILAEKLWSNGNYAASVTEFDKVTQRDPKGILGRQALFRSAMTQALFLSQNNLALRKFKSYIEQSGDSDVSWEAQKQIGEILFAKTEQYDLAIPHYRAMLQARPKDPEAPDFQFRIAKSYFFLWQFDDAIFAFKELQKNYPNSLLAERAAFEIGVTAYTRGEQRPATGHSTGPEGYQEAIDAYQRFLTRYPHSALDVEARFGIAACLEEMEQLDAAYHQYESLLKTYPSPKVIQIKLARIRQRRAQKSR